MHPDDLSDRNFNKQEIEDFFGIDAKEMERLIDEDSRKSLEFDPTKEEAKHHNENNDYER